jgi:phosphoadenosine phosphosulfate reductase
MSALVDLVEDTQATLHRIVSEFTPAVLASSLAAEDMVLTDLILRAKLPIAIFTLETGRLHTQTLDMLDRIRETYDYRVRLYKPEQSALDAYVRRYGMDAFYESIDLRKECCRIRKVEPLQRALAGNKAWITGQRRAQAATRTGLAVQEEDAAHGMVKFSPLADWSEEDVWCYIRNHKVPYNVLHDQGYPSIGCEPCTRAVQPGEDVRAGRWWWEQADTKECGLHYVAAADGTQKLVRVSAQDSVGGAKAK